MIRQLTYAAAIGSLAACAELVAFEQRAAPEIAKGCAYFHTAEANPLVQLALAGGSVATGGIVGSIKSFGDAFCSMGPPATDPTSTAQQAQWITGVALQLLAAVGVK